MFNAKVIVIALFVVAFSLFVIGCSQDNDEDAGLPSSDFSLQIVPLSDPVPSGKYCDPDINPYCAISHLEPSEQLMLVHGDDTLW